MKKRFSVMLDGQTLAANLFDEHGRETVLAKGTALTPEVLGECSYEAITRIRLTGRKPAARE